MQTGHTDVQVLIVDDQASFRRVARSVIELTPGFAYAGEVDTGEAALEFVRCARSGAAKTLDLVLMDVHLPGIDGLDATRQMLAAGSGTPPLVFLLSTYQEDEYAEQPTECGAAAYLSKAEFGSERLCAAWASANPLPLCSRGT